MFARLDLTHDRSQGFAKLADRRRCSVCIALPAYAQAPEPKSAAQSRPPRQARSHRRPPSKSLDRFEKIPEATRRDQSRGIDFLLGALKVAPNAAAARHVEGRTWALLGAHQQRHRYALDDARKPRATPRTPISRSSCWTPPSS